MKVTVLGCGTVGTTAVMMLDAYGVDEIKIGDVNVDYASKIASQLTCDARALKCNARNPNELKEVIRGSDVVLNCVGPFYEFGPLILKASIEEGINYVDICDDLDATIEQLKLSDLAKEKDVSAVIGMGSSPGLANLLAKFCENFMEVESVDIYHAHGGEETEGAAVVKHRIHSMKMDIPVFLDGEFKNVRLFEESGKALEEEVEFPEIGTFRVYAYPHPETITLPKYIKNVKRVTNLGLVLPPEYAELIKTIVRIGMADETPIRVGELEIPAIEFAVSFILSKREELIKKAGMKEPVGSLMVVVGGKMNGKREKLSFALSSRGQGMGEGTGIPAAIGAILMGEGRITEKGVLPPEACINPLDAFTLAQKMLKSTGKGDLPLIIERIKEDGTKERIDYKSILPL
ncbi:MAG: saccharopine dehydrogenase NADP-binding domain-containing protein [Archaeoglobus sp.]|nr:saccharopine dehydrogenase NADP-binding domain-containing protein [Archaeoglobus sp.]